MSVTPQKFAIIDPLGRHGGFHYYVDGAARGLVEAGHDTIVYVTRFTGVDPMAPYSSRAAFGQLYGTEPTLVRAARYFSGLARAIISARRRRVSAVFLHSFHCDARELAAIWGTRLWGMKAIVTWHDIETFGNARPSWIKRLCIRGASGMVFQNRFSQAEFERLNGAPKVPVAIIPHGHYIHAFPDPIGRSAARQQLGLPQAERLLLFFGNPREEKGLDLLVDALAGLQDLPSWRLVVAGKMKPAHREAFNAHLNLAGIEDRVDWNHNFIPDEEAVAYYRAADLVVLPYRRVYESGVAIMAMSFSRAVLASDLEPFVDLVGANRHGFLFREGDVENLRQTLHDALARNADFDSIGARGQQSMIETRNWSLIGDRLARLAVHVAGQARRVMATPRATQLSVYQVARSAHIERLAQFNGTRRLLFCRANYDFNRAEAAKGGARQVGLLAAFWAILSSESEIIELNEPFYLRALPLILVSMMAGHLLVLRGRSKPHFVTYAIENADMLAVVGHRTRLSPRLVSWLCVPALRWIVGQFDRIAFGTEAAQENYCRVIGRLPARIKTQLFPALEPVCPTCTLAKNPHSVIFVGAFEPRKGIDVLMAAWPQVAAQFPAARLTLIGKGERLKQVRAFVSNREDVCLMVDPSRNCIHEQLSHSEILVLPSRSLPTWREQIGLPVLEGLSHGCRIVTTQDTGLAGWLRMHGHRITNDAEDVGKLADTLVDCLQAPSRHVKIVSDLPQTSGRQLADGWLWAK